MLVLDTEAVSVLFNPRDALRIVLERRLERPDAVPHATSVVTYQEQARGWLAEINRAKAPAQLLKAYRGLFKMKRDYDRLQLLPFDAAAQTLFEQFRRQKLRTPTLDLRIACVALAHHAKLLTSNLRDFCPVPGLAVEDWAV